MFNACVQRFDGMDEKFLGGELNRALSRLSSIGFLMYPLGEGSSYSREYKNLYIYIYIYNSRFR